MENQVVTIDSRNSFSMTGVKSVDCFTDAKIKLTVQTGNVVIIGHNLVITAFTTGGGTFSCNGKITSLTFLDAKEGIVRRILR